VGPAPIPPHERHWRHPSELAATADDVEFGSSRRAIVLATGTTALLLAAVLVVALAPTRSSAPSAVSATTLPAATIELASRPTLPEPADQGVVLTFRSMVLRDHSVALVGAPNAISAAPVGDTDDLALAGRVPNDDERVLVLTRSHAYDLAWHRIDDIAAPDGSIVMTRDGDLVATFVSGELRLLVD
jgi:hypothetical protein